MKSGFTLVELSIVLVIIGLLIGGILVGQSLIQSVALSSTVSQIKQVDVAINIFTQKYRQIPGDSSLFNPLGNNDGFLASDGTGLQPLIHESGYFFHDLHLGAGLKNPAGGGFEQQELLGGRTESNAIIPAMSDYAVPNTNWPAHLYAGTNNNSTSVLRQVDYSLYYGAASSWRPLDAYAIDKKIDDGMPRTGHVSYESLGSRGFCIDGSRSDPVESVGYDLANDSFTCGITIAPGFAAGRL